MNQTIHLHFLLLINLYRQVARKVVTNHTNRRGKEIQPPLSQWAQLDRNGPFQGPRPKYVFVSGGKWSSLKEQPFSVLKYCFLSQTGMCNLWGINVAFSIPPIPCPPSWDRVTTFFACVNQANSSPYTSEL
jgi:hypothetical protein